MAEGQFFFFSWIEHNHMALIFTLTTSNKYELQQNLTATGHIYMDTSKVHFNFKHTKFMSTPYSLSCIKPVHSRADFLVLRTTCTFSMCRAIISPANQCCLHWEARKMLSSYCTPSANSWTLQAAEPENF